MNNPEQSAAFYDKVAASYDAALAQNSANNAVRTAFHRLVQHYVPVGSRIMDFGCGTGTDALAYIQMGYRVMAYDNSPGMMAELAHKGQVEIANGQLTPLQGHYETIISTLHTLPPASAVVSNFAVVNQIENMREWVGAMAGYIEGGGWLMVNLLNPFYWWDMRRGWWWRGLRQGWNKGYIPFHNNDGFTTYRHFIGTLKQMGRAVGLHLKVEQSAGMLLPIARPGREKTLPFRLAGTLEEKWGRAWGVRSLGNFIFLAWQKNR